MNELKYELLTEVLGQMEAELLKLYLQTYEIEVELFEEATTSNVIPVSFGRVQIFVEKENAERARKILEEYKNTTPG
jgi:hypothetical protein